MKGSFGNSCNAFYCDNALGGHYSKSLLSIFQSSKRQIALYSPSWSVSITITFHFPIILFPLGFSSSSAKNIFLLQILQIYAFFYFLIFEKAGCTVLVGWLASPLIFPLQIFPPFSVLFLLRGPNILLFQIFSPFSFSIFSSSRKENIIFLLQIFS